MEENDVECLLWGDWVINKKQKSSWVVDSESKGSEYVDFGSLVLGL